MAKAHRDDDHGRVKFRLIEVEFEGSNASIEEGLRTIANAIGRTKEVPTYVQLPAVPPQVAAQLPAPAVPVEADSLFDADDVPVEPRRSKTPSKPKNVHIPQILDLDFASASVPLKDFCAEKNPKTAFDKYIVLAYWLRHHLGIVDFTADHIHTCYRLMNWPTPKDAGQPLRDLRNPRKQWLSKGTNSGEYQINHIGENAVMVMGA